MQVDEIQADIPELTYDVSRIKGHLESAESCETKADLIENLESALADAEQLVTQLRSCVRSAKKAS